MNQNERDKKLIDLENEPFNDFAQEAFFFHVEQHKATEDVTYKRMIENLVRVRKAQGLTQEIIAYELKSHTGTISRWENCHVTPNLFDFLCWCRVLKIKLRLESLHEDEDGKQI